ncbi:MAG: DUF1844 domain-containing protein [Verrucomicrobia bacterium]|nr:DUF1844 domain-containing protein [Verrucomicrobiota bacterium]
MNTPAPADAMAERFAEFVLHHANLALIMMGRVPHPESGETMQDLDYTRMLIDQLEMLEVKTAGNLSPQESALLKQSLTTVRLAFVEAVEKPAAQPAPPVAVARPPEPKAETPPPAPASASPAPAEEDAPAKRFSKKY